MPTQDFAAWLGIDGLKASHSSNLGQDPNTTFNLATNLRDLVLSIGVLHPTPPKSAKNKKSVAKEPDPDDPRGLSYVPHDADPAATDRIYLQVWEVDIFEGGKKHAQDAEGKTAPTSNQLLLEIPGFLKQLEKGTDKFEFRVLDKPTVIASKSDKAYGWFRIALKDKDGKDWKDADGKNLAVPITGEAEDEIDLGCALEPTPGVKTWEKASWARSAVFHCTNMTHALQAMLSKEEGGLTVAFWAALNTKEDADDLEKARLELRKKSGADQKTYMASAKTRSGKKAIWGEPSVNNDEEFPLGGQWLARNLHCVGFPPSGAIEANKVTLANDLILTATPYAGTDGLREIVNAVQKIRDKVKSDFLGADSKDDPPKVRRLLICTHGMPTYIKGGYHDVIKASTDGNVDTAFAATVKDLSAHLTKDVLVTLFACNTASSWDEYLIELAVDMKDPEKKKSAAKMWAAKGKTIENAFGREPGQNERLGEGSFARIMRRLLYDNGLEDAAVWAHTNAGRAQRNPCLRAFTRWGACDIVWMVKTPTANVSSDKGDQTKTSSDRDDIAMKWQGKWTNTETILRAACCHPGEEAKRVLEATKDEEEPGAVSTAKEGAGDSNF